MGENAWDLSRGDSKCKGPGVGAWTQRAKAAGEGAAQ